MDLPELEPMFDSALLVCTQGHRALKCQIIGLVPSHSYSGSPSSSLYPLGGPG